MVVLRRYLWVVVALLAACLTTTPTVAQDKEPSDGMLVTVPNPINDGILNQIKSSVDRIRTNPKSNIKKVVFDFNPEGKEAATESYGPCYELAKYVKQLQQNGMTTVAFVHGKVTRHTVLPVLACDDLIMSAGGAIGEVASKDRTVTRAEIDYYLELAGISRAGAVLKMMDREVKLVKARYKEATIYVDQRRVDAKDPAYTDVFVTDKSPVAGLSGGYELYNTANARKFLDCKLQAETLDDIAGWYQFKPGWKDTNPIGEGGIKACRIMVEGKVDERLRGKINRQIEVAKRRKENYFFFVLEIEGGSWNEAAKIAETIIGLGKDPEYKARTIAFIPNKAANVATFLAFACQEIVMYKGPDPTKEAVLGDFDAYINDPRLKTNIDFMRRTLTEKVTNERGIPAVLVEGLFNKELLILNVRNSKTNERRLMTEAEFQADQDKVWVREGVVKEKGAYLTLNASKAKNLRLASVIDNKDINEVYALYGVEQKTVREAEPTVLDDFAGFLGRPQITVLLIIIGIAGLVLELKAPGLIIPGVIGALCFILFFWSQTQLGGQLIYLAIMLFILGLVLLAVEIFVIPGFGFTGVLGILLILAGLVLAGIDKTPDSTDEWLDLAAKMIFYGLTMAGAVILSFVVSRFLPKIPYANRLMLVPPEDRIDLDEETSLPGVEQAISLLGHVGSATSMLRPAGMAKFGERFVDVVTEGDFIEPGTPIQVVEVEGSRIVVKRV